MNASVTSSFTQHIDRIGRGSKRGESLAEDEEGEDKKEEYDLNSSTRKFGEEEEEEDGGGFRMVNSSRRRHRALRKGRALPLAHPH